LGRHGGKLVSADVSEQEVADVQAALDRVAAASS